MLLTLTTTHRPATDLGYLLHKSPSRLQSFDLSFGLVHVFYPEASAERCTAAILLDVDSIGLVRNRKGPEGDGGLLQQYVNDRPYVASSFLSVALSRVFRTALSGRSKERQELASQPLPLEARIACVRSSGGAELISALFTPLGYDVRVEPHPLDSQHPEWGGPRYFTVTLAANKPLSEVLSHLYVLIPVLDDEKHYWVTEDEVEKLLQHGEGWLSAHPARELIARRYLKHQRGLARDALAQLSEADGADADESTQLRGEAEAQLEATLSLNEQRIQAVVRTLRESGASRVLDLGCGAGTLLKALLAERSFSQVVGMDVALASLEWAKQRLELDRMPDQQRQRLTLLHGSLLYRDQRLLGFDAAAVIEVIEHLDPPRLAAAERVVFEFSRPKTVVITTPNAEYNAKFERLVPGAFRHKDHRFEWTRAEFEAWSSSLAARFGYSVTFAPIGAVDEMLGPPTQMAVFQR